MTRFFGIVAVLGLLFTSLVGCTSPQEHLRQHQEFATADSGVTFDQAGIPGLVDEDGNPLQLKNLQAAVVELGPGSDPYGAPVLVRGQVITNPVTSAILETAQAGVFATEAELHGVRVFGELVHNTGAGVSHYARAFRTFQDLFAGQGDRMQVTQRLKGDFAKAGIPGTGPGGAWTQEDIDALLKAANYSADQLGGIAFKAALIEEHLLEILAGLNP